MLNLDPAKLLVIAVVAIILLGPDKLPQVARQVGGAWRSFNEFRHRMETEVRSSMPDLPSTTEIARLARSPSALLDHLSNMGTDEVDEVDDDPVPEQADGETTEPAAVVGGDAPSLPNGSVPPEVEDVEAAAMTDTTLPTAAPTFPATPTAPSSPSPSPATPPDVTPDQRSPDVIVPGDPSLN
jgi:sec-independent protein translocase protein TatB